MKKYLSRLESSTGAEPISDILMWVFLPAFRLPVSIPRRSLIFWHECTAAHMILNNIKCGRDLPSAWQHVPPPQVPRQQLWMPLSFPAGELPSGMRSDVIYDFCLMNNHDEVLQDRLCWWREYYQLFVTCAGPFFRFIVITAAVGLNIPSSVCCTSLFVLCFPPAPKL